MEFLKSLSRIDKVPKQETVILDLDKIQIVSQAEENFDFFDLYGFLLRKSDTIYFKDKFLSEDRCLRNALETLSSQSPMKPTEESSQKLYRQIAGCTTSKKKKLKRRGEDEEDEDEEEEEEDDEEILRIIRKKDTKILPKKKTLPKVTKIIEENDLDLAEEGQVEVDVSESSESEEDENENYESESDFEEENETAPEDEEEDED